MYKALGTALAAVLLVGVGTASAQTKNTRTSRLSLVRAYCTTGPCDQFFSFTGGVTLLKKVKQPKLVTNRKLGRVRINSLQALGPDPIPANLEAEAKGTIFYGADLNAVCPFANTTVTGTFATSTLLCTIGVAGDATCSGNLFFTDFTPPECSDVSQVIQDISVAVYEGGSVGVPEKRIAVFGANILGRIPDCASGGSGCP